MSTKPLDPVVSRAQRGEEAAFGELFERHRGDVTRLVHRTLSGSPDVEDVVQEVFVHVFRSLPKFRGDSRFSTWLYRLTLNVARMHLRRGRSRPRVVDVPVPETPRGVLGESHPDGPDRLADRARRVAALYRLIDGLSEKKRTVLVLHDLQGVPPKEIAETVAAPVMTVRTRLFYARKELYAAIASDPELAPSVEALLAELPGRPKGRRANADRERRPKGPPVSTPARAEGKR